MKKVILSIVGVISLTTGSWGQEFNYINDIYPPSVPRTNLFFSQVEGTSEIINGSWTYKEPHGPTFRWYTNNSGFTLLISDIGEMIIYDNDMNYMTGVFNGEIIGFPGLLDNSFEPTTGSNWAVGWDDGSQGSGPGYTNGMFLPISNPTGDASGGVIAQAEQLNIGLEFINGRWTPAE